MPKNVVSFKFVSGTNGYITDLNQDLSINARFVAPPDLDGIAIGAMVTAVGGVITTETVPCELELADRDLEKTQLEILSNEDHTKAK